MEYKESEKSDKDFIREYINLSLTELKRHKVESRSVEQKLINSLQELLQDIDNLSTVEILHKLQSLQINSDNKEFQRQFTNAFSRIVTHFPDITIVKEALITLKNHIDRIALYPTPNEFNKLKDIVSGLKNFAKTPGVAEECQTRILNLLKLNYQHREAGFLKSSPLYHSFPSRYMEDVETFEKVKNLQQYREFFEAAFVDFGGKFIDVKIDLKNLDDKQKVFLEKVIAQELQNKKPTNNETFKLRKRDAYYIGNPPDITRVTLSNSLILRQKNDEPIMEIIDVKLGEGGMGSVKEVYGYIELNNNTFDVKQHANKLAVKSMSNEFVDQDDITSEGKTTEKLLKTDPMVQRTFQSQLRKQHLKSYMFVPKITGGQFTPTNLEKFTEEKLIDIGMDLVKDLQKIHNEKYVHLDISHRNVMVDENGKITFFDFGLSLPKDIHERVAGATADYASPEAQESANTGKKIPITEKLDIYSLGKLFENINQVLIKKNLPQSIKDEFLKLIKDMTSTISEKRPSLEKVMQTLDGIKKQMHSLNEKQEIIPPDEIKGPT